MKINIITLGCSKNLVDSEYLLSQFKANGHEVFHDENEIAADVVILNTCGFILDAKQESIDTILYQLQLKADGIVKKVIVMGCLSERYREELTKEMPDVDGFFGVWDHQEIVKAVGSIYYHELVNDRLITTPSHFAFLKISEGCNRACSFCAIPGIRGAQRSRSIEALVDEAENLSGRGAREMILIAQDLTSYGTDLYKKKGLADLLKSLVKINDIDWIRMHYAYPTGFPLEVIELMASEPKICNYLDIPIQHINDRLLSAMNRGHSRKKLENLLYSFREKVPDVALRTTLLVGYPGETDAEFEELYDFVKHFKFDRLGVFPYSHEEKTPVGEGAKDNVPQSLKQERMERIMELQQEISLELNQAKVGKEFKVIVDEEEDDFFIGRTEYDSPEVDNSVLISKTKELKTGEFYNVKITDSQEFDLFGEVS